MTAADGALVGVLVGLIINIIGWIIMIRLFAYRDK